MWRASATTAVVVALFFAGQPPTKVAIVIGGLLLVTRRVRSERIFAQIDWPLLLMFAGLFIIVAGAEPSLLESDAIAAAGRLQLDCLPVLSALTAILSKFDQQRAGGGGTETVRRELAQSRPGLADGSDGLDFGRQSDRARLDRQPDRRPACRRWRYHDRGVGLLPGRRAADPADLADRDNLAEDLTGDGPLTFFEMLARSTTASRIGKVASDQKPRW